MKVFLLSLFSLTVFYYPENRLQTDNKLFRSEVYGYSLNIPSGFKREIPHGKNIDLKLVKSDGSSIIINVTKRLAEEYSITAHNYSKEMFEKEFERYTPECSIVKAEKTFIDGCNAFMIYYINSNVKTEALEIYLFKNAYAYVLTGTSGIELFPDYEKIFLTTFNTIKLK
jgi:hypothetical protein